MMVMEADKTYLAQFRRGDTPMSLNAVDYYLSGNGETIEHHWAMGGSSKKVVKSVPEQIDGFTRLRGGVKCTQ